jgi:hypothetical protein
MSYVKKLLSSSRTLIVLLSITMAFTIAIYFNSKKGKGVESPLPAKVADVGIDFSDLGQQEDLKAIQVKLDGMARGSMMRDTVIVREILNLQHSGGMHQEKNPMCPSCAGSSRQNVAKVGDFH